MFDLYRAILSLVCPRCETPVDPPMYCGFYKAKCKYYGITENGEEKTEVLKFNDSEYMIFDKISTEKWNFLTISCKENVKS